MSTAGLSKSRLERMHQVLSGYVERKKMPGLVALVNHHDDVHVETLGTMSFGHPAPMKRDAIFRIASLAKPITAVAAMILVEECKLRLDESIEQWLPELANRRVLKSMSSQPDDNGAGAPCDHRSRFADVPNGFRQCDGDAGHLSDSEVDPRISNWWRRPNGFGMAVDIQRNRNLPHPRPIRLGRRLRHIGITPIRQRE
jgi:hypothetical protein